MGVRHHHAVHTAHNTQHTCATPLLPMHDHLVPPPHRPNKGVEGGSDKSLRHCALCVIPLEETHAPVAKVAYNVTAEHGHVPR